MWSQVDGLGLPGAGVLWKRRQRLFADVEEVESEVADDDDDTSHAVRQERPLCSYITVKTVKRYSSPEQVISELRSVRHLPHGITQCYLPPDTSESAPSNPSQTGWYSINVPRKDGRLG